MRDWGQQLVDRVMTEADPDGRMVDLPWALVGKWWKPA